MGPARLKFAGLIGSGRLKIWAYS